MEITCHHSASSHGIPVILSDNGEVMDYPEGLTAALDRLGWSRQEVAIKAGYKGARSIEKFWQRDQPSAQLLNVLAVALTAQR